MEILFPLLLFVVFGFGVVFVLWVLRRPELANSLQLNDKKLKAKYRVENIFVLSVIVVAFISGAISFFLSFPLLDHGFYHQKLANEMAASGLLINFLVAARFGEIKGGRMGSGRGEPFFKKGEPTWTKVVGIMLIFVLDFCVLESVLSDGQHQTLFGDRFLGSLVMLFSFSQAKNISFNLLDILRKA